MMMMMMVMMMNQWTWGYPTFRQTRIKVSTKEPLGVQPPKLCTCLWLTRHMVNKFLAALEVPRLLHETQNQGNFLISHPNCNPKWGLSLTIFESFLGFGMSPRLPGAAGSRCSKAGCCVASAGVASNVGVRQWWGGTTGCRRTYGGFHKWGYPKNDGL